MPQAWSEKHNSFLRPLKKKGYKEERVTTIGLYDIGKSHDPGIQQEPLLLGWGCSVGPPGRCPPTDAPAMGVLPGTPATPPRRGHAYAYLITSSAWNRSAGGIVRPSALAVLRLMTSSNFMGCSTGRSPGLAPLRILST